MCLRRHKWVNSITLNKTLLSLHITVKWWKLIWVVMLFSKLIRHRHLEQYKSYIKHLEMHSFQNKATKFQFMRQNEITWHLPCVIRWWWRVCIVISSCRSWSKQFFWCWMNRRKGWSRKTFLWHYNVCSNLGLGSIWYTLTKYGTV